MALVTQAHNGDKAARDELVLRNLGLVFQVAERYRNRSSLEFDDLVQSGTEGLMHAIDTFDVGRGTKLSTHAVWRIRNSISREVVNEGRTIRLPAHMEYRLYAVRKAASVLEQENGQVPDGANIAGATGLTEQKVEDILSVSRRPLSLDQPVHTDEDLTLGELIADEALPSPDNEVDIDQLEAAVDEALCGLDTKDQHVIRHRIGLYGNEPKQMIQIAAMMGISRSLAGFYFERGMKKLRYARPDISLKSWYND